MFGFRDFGMSLDEEIDRIVFGSQTMRQSMENIIRQQISAMKAAEIYEDCDTSIAPLEEEAVGERVMRLRSGDNLSVEEQANEMLVSSRRREGKFADRREWLTTEQIMLRQHKEVYNQNGFPDVSLVSGMYRRVHNPLSGSRPGKHKGEEQ